MRIFRYFVSILVISLLIAPQPGWSASESSKSAGSGETAAAEKEAGGSEQIPGPGADFQASPPEDEPPTTFGPISPMRPSPRKKASSPSSLPGRFPLSPTLFPQAGGGFQPVETILTLTSW